WTDSQSRSAFADSQSCWAFVDSQIHSEFADTPKHWALADSRMHSELVDTRKPNPHQYLAHRQAPPSNSALSQRKRFYASDGSSLRVIPQKCESYTTFPAAWPEAHAHWKL